MDALLTDKSCVASYLLEYGLYRYERHKRESVLSRCQFHQHFTREFFLRKYFEKLFSMYVLALEKGFWQKEHYEKRAHKMLMKLTTALSSRRLSIRTRRAITSSWTTTAKSTRCTLSLYLQSLLQVITKLMLK